MKAQPALSKADLVSDVAEKTGESQASTKRVIDETIEAITKSLKKGRPVTIVGFGTFAIAVRKARTGRNPKTGETIKIKGGKTPKFRAGKGLKDAVK
ncbi:MAG: HU family DNA-binding protein [Betaproteobacteria bacterium]|nr:HU family DNA-binding protein [Betaproteobacteria bacterium]